MKKFKRCLTAVFLAVVLVGMCMLCGCYDKTSTENGRKADPYISIQGEEENGLVYHKKSKTVYILFTGTSGGYGEYGFCSLYVQNGHFCEYRDGKIVEIDGTESTTSKFQNGQTPDEIWSSMTDEEKAEILKEGR